MRLDPSGYMRLAPIQRTWVDTWAWVHGFDITDITLVKVLDDLGHGVQRVAVQRHRFDADGKIRLAGTRRRVLKRIDVVTTRFSFPVSAA